MKKLLSILPVIFLSIALHAQQTEDEVFVGKGKTFGNYKGTAIIIPDIDKTVKKPTTDLTSLTGTVISGGLITLMDSLTDKRVGLYSFNLKKADGTIVTVGTKANGFAVPKAIVGKTITVEGIDAGQISGRKRRDVKNDAQQDIQFAATGIIIID